MNKYEDSKIILTEKIKENYGQLAVDIAEGWNKAMDKLHDEDEKYVLEIIGDSKDYIDEISKYLNIEFPAAVGLAIQNLLLLIRKMKKYKT